METSVSEQIELRKLELETRRMEIDAELRKEELQEKREQRKSEQQRAEQDHERGLRQLEAESGRGLRLTGAQATVAAAILALIGGAIGAVAQGWFSRDATVQSATITADNALKLDQQKQDADEKLKRLEFETNLIMKAVDTPNRDDQIRNLLFFVHAGFITDKDNKIAGMEATDLTSAAAKSTVQICGAKLSQFSPSLVDLLTRFEGEVPAPCDIERAQAAVKSLVKPTLKENELNALTSLVYNLGAGTLSRSTLLADINADNREKIRGDFLSWNKIAGFELPGLTRRREEEAALFLGEAAAFPDTEKAAEANGQ